MKMKKLRRVLMTAKMITAIENYRAALNGIDRAAYLACFTTDALLQDPYGGRPLQGVDGLNKFFTGMERAWASFEMTFGEPYLGGNRVAVSWSVTAVAKSGKTANFSGINLFTLNDDGLISQLDGYWDAAAMMAQLS
jgi:steroid Delta-isomerase